MNPNVSPRVRFAPSPTGELHIGGLRTALYNYLFARKHHGEFIIRVEDTDAAREVPGAAARLLRVLEEIGLHYDEGPEYSAEGEYRRDRGTLGPYLQSKRLDRYTTAVETLITRGAAYWCDCTSERLEKVRAENQAQKRQPKYDGQCRNKKLAREEGSFVRLRLPDEAIIFSDVIHGEIQINGNDVDDQVLMKSDGFPTYHLANVVDDHDMKITHVIRGEDWLPSTPKHILLYRAFAWDTPTFAHLPLLKSSQGGKLSKREGDMSVQHFLDQGYLPESLINFCALLGWNPQADQELYTIDELIAQFDLTKVNKSGAALNFEKLQWMNRVYLKKMEPRHLIIHALPILESQGFADGDEETYALPNTDLVVTKETLASILALGLERASTIAEAIESIKFFFERPKLDKDLLIWKKQTAEELKNLLPKIRASLNAHDPWEAGEIAEHLKTFCTDEKLDVGAVFWPVRVALSGQRGSPAPEVIAALLGKNETLRRIDLAYAAPG